MEMMLFARPIRVHLASVGRAVRERCARLTARAGLSLAAMALAVQPVEYRTAQLFASAFWHPTSAMDRECAASSTLSGHYVVVGQHGILHAVVAGRVSKYPRGDH